MPRQDAQNLLKNLFETLMDKKTSIKDLAEFFTPIISRSLMEKCLI